MITDIKKCFSLEETNRGRQPELDLAKGLAILFMVWTHVFEELSPQSEGVLVTLVRNILGGPFAAPIFMICVGIGICYSRKNTPLDLLKRGVSMLGIGLLLNVFRYVVPDLIQFAILNDPGYLDATFSLFSVDILQFVGLAFIFLAGVKKLQLKHSTLMLIGMAASALGMMLRWVSTGDYISDQFIGFIWGTRTETYFPFLNWIIFPIAGLIFGSFLKCCRDKKTFYKRATPICGGLMLIYLFLTIQFGFMFSSGGSYYFLGLLDSVFFIILAIAVFGVCYAVLQLFPKVSFQPLFRWSNHTNSIYCIHWTLIGMLGIVFNLLGKTKNMQFWQVTLLTAIILLLSDYLSAWYLNRIKPSWKK